MTSVLTDSNASKSNSEWNPNGGFDGTSEIAPLSGVSPLQLPASKLWQ